MGENSNYKDSVFSSLFSNPDVLRDLYSAIKGIPLPPDIPVTINTLDNALYMNMVNDISFEIGGKLVILIEHQSTINQNMPLRLLMYIGRVYEKILKKENIYRTKLMPIPRPEFFVLYNGTAWYPSEKTLKLSDAFEKSDDLGLSGTDYYSLELEVKVLNINEGMNKEITNGCPTLGDYSTFVAKIREYEKEGTGKEDAFKRAIQYCLEHEILKDFFEKNASEVINMLYAEWNMDDYGAVRFDEGREEGLQEGREDTARKALAEGASLDFIHKITGLDMEKIEALQVKGAI